MFAVTITSTILGIVGSASAGRSTAANPWARTSERGPIAVATNESIELGVDVFAEMEFLVMGLRIVPTKTISAGAGRCGDCHP